MYPSPKRVLFIFSELRRKKLSALPVLRKLLSIISSRKHSISDAGGNLKPALIKFLMGLLLSSETSGEEVCNKEDAWN